MDDCNVDFDISLAEVDVFIAEMMIKDNSTTLNLDTIYSLYRRWCNTTDRNHVDHYHFKSQLTKELTFIGRARIAYVNGWKINETQVKELKIIERKMRQT